MKTMLIGIMVTVIVCASTAHAQEINVSEFAEYAGKLAASAMLCRQTGMTFDESAAKLGKIIGAGPYACTETVDDVVAIAAHALVKAFEGPLVNDLEVKQILAHHFYEFYRKEILRLLLSAKE